jgi:Domain of unknown function (DUF4832)
VLNKNKTFIVYFFFLLSNIAFAQSTLTVHPLEYTGALKNPLKGFRYKAITDTNELKKFTYATLVRDYIKWSDIENDSTDGVEKIVEVCNKRWKNYEKLNIKVIPRVFILWDKKSTKGNWPTDIENGDWSSPKFKERVVKLIYKLGKAWDNDERVAWVQTGLIGYWGEQESPVGVHQDGWAKKLGEAFTNAFKNKKLIVRNQAIWDNEGYFLGTYWDSYAHPQQPKVYKEIKERNNKGRYITQIIEGETAYDWGKEKFSEKFGATPTATCNSSFFTNNLIDVIKDLHCSALGWISSYKTDGSENSNKDTVLANAEKIQNAFGYNFIIEQFSCKKNEKSNSSISFEATVKNIGSAPFYESWPVCIVLINEATQEVVYKEIMQNVDITKWLPGDDYNYETKSYNVPAMQNVIKGVIKIPNTLKHGNYMVAISIAQPTSLLPGIFFSIKNFLAKSQLQPLCKISLGNNRLSVAKLDSSIFDNPFLNDNRNYIITKTFQ